MHVKKSILSTLIAALLVAGLFAGCSSSGTPSTPAEEPAGESEPAGEAPAEGEGDAAPAEGGLSGSFSFIHFNSETDSMGTGGAFWKMVEAFKSENPDVNIDMEFIDHDDYQPYITTLMAGDALPDLFMIKGDLVPTMADGDLIYASEEIIKEDSAWYSQFVDGAFDDGTYNGTGYLAPMQMQANAAVVYNTKILAEAGVESFPQTYSEMLEAVELIREAGYTPIGLGNGGQWLAPSCVLNTFMYRYVDGDWFQSLRDNSGAKFTDDAVVQGLADFQALANAGAFNDDMNSIDEDGMYELYYNEECAIVINGAWVIGRFIENAPQEVLDNSEVTLMWAADGDPGTWNNVAAATGWGYVFNKNLDGDNLEAAKAFVKRLTVGEYADIALELGFFSAAEASNVNESALAPLFAKYMAVESQMNYLPVWDVVLPASVGSGEYYAATQELLINAVTPEQMAERLQAAMEATY